MKTDRKPMYLYRCPVMGAMFSEAGTITVYDEECEAPQFLLFKTKKDGRKCPTCKRELEFVGER